MLYGPNAGAFPDISGWRDGRKYNSPRGDQHPDAAEWDDPAKHEALVADLLANYDGWGIALNPDNLWHYLRWVPIDTRVCAWVKPDAFPTGRIVRSWEPVLIHVPKERRTRGEIQLRDSKVLPWTTAKGSKERFVGAKPKPWTRWVLDMLGYQPDEDTIDDLFGGSGAVTAEINQGVLL
jgi:hypothetical protein